MSPLVGAMIPQIHSSLIDKTNRKSAVFPFFKLLIPPKPLTNGTADS